MKSIATKQFTHTLQECYYITKKSINHHLNTAQINVYEIHENVCISRQEFDGISANHTTITFSSFPANKRYEAYLSEWSEMAQHFNIKTASEKK